MNSESQKTGVSGSMVQKKIDAFLSFLASRNAVDPYVQELSGDNGIADAIIVAGATSGRHAQGIADGMRCVCRDNGWEFLGTEGYEQAQWILVDGNDIIIHILQEEARDLYRLEELFAASTRLREKESHQ